MSGRHILISDPDPETARLLAPQLRQRGHTVSLVHSGSRALELCVLRAPDLVLFDVASPMLAAQTFRQILRANPRTEHVPVLVTGQDSDRNDLGLVRAGLPLGDGFLSKPFNVDEVLAQIDQIFRRAEAAQRARRSDQGMDGNLGQLSLVDLLQVLGQARKSGELRIVGPKGSAAIRLSEGLVASAQAESTRGPKAFFRLLTWRDGTFSFVPGDRDPSAPEDIGKPIEELLLEGLRQSDELGSIRDQLPDPGARLVVTPLAEPVLGDQSPVALEILDLARDSATLGEVIERSRATDFVAAHTLLSLLQRGLLEAAAGDLSPRSAPRPLLTPGAAHALRVALLQRRTEGSRPRGKLLLSAADPSALAGFLERLASIPGCAIALDEIRAFGSQFGSIGRLDLLDDLALDLLQFPTDEPSRPLWLPFSSRAIGALVLIGPGETTAPRSLLAFFARGLAIPVLLVGPAAVPIELEDLGPLLSATPEGPAEALRLLLVRASQRPAPTM